MNEYANRVHNIVKDAPLNDKQKQFIIKLIDDLAKSNDSEQLLQMYGSPENFIEQHSGEEQQDSTQTKVVTTKRTPQTKSKQNNIPHNQGLSKVIKILYYILIRIPFIFIRVIATILILGITVTIATSPLTSVATVTSAIVIILATLSFFISLNAIITNTYQLIIKYLQFNTYESHKLYYILIWSVLTFIAFIIFNIGIHGLISSISLSALTDRFKHITNLITNFIN